MLPDAVPGLLHDLLLVEYHFGRIYINSVTLQAIAARTTGETNSSLRYPFEIDDYDSSSVREIVDGCTAILHIVLRLNDANQLKYIPNRVSVRIASAAMYLVKVGLISLSGEASRPTKSTHNSNTNYTPTGTGRRCPGRRAQLFIEPSGSEPRSFRISFRR